eukprot:TRINITY_DN2734_c0_g1_i5.p2 TRINITY_DN2734_c0_g1~~TRINITY_DN2734_c0_g1_i5.p2  ORF type:complete len:139 (-),score=19.41 TRINITY_DN2734_c0_g1_i5:225-641(-)
MEIQEGNTEQTAPLPEPQEEYALSKPKRRLYREFTLLSTIAAGVVVVPLFGSFLYGMFHLLNGSVRGQARSWEMRLASQSLILFVVFIVHDVLGSKKKEEQIQKYRDNLEYAKRIRQEKRLKEKQQREETVDLIHQKE